MTKNVHNYDFTSCFGYLLPTRLCFILFIHPEFLSPKKGKSLTCAFKTIDCFIRMLCVCVFFDHDARPNICKSMEGVACALNLAAPGGCVRWPRERSGARVALGAGAMRTNCSALNRRADHIIRLRYPICVHALATHHGRPREQASDFVSLPERK